MHSKKKRALYDIRDCILSAHQFTAGFDLEKFCEDRKTFHATTRMLEIISEASKYLDDAVRNRHSEIEWRSIKNSGNYYRHDYDNVAENYVWSAVVNRLPPLLAVIMVEIERLEAEEIVTKRGP